MPSLDVAINALRASTGAKQFDDAVRKIQRGSKDVDRSVKQNDTSMNKLGFSLNRVALGLVSVATAYKGLRLAQGAVREFALFESQLANVSTMLSQQTMHYLPLYRKDLQGLAQEFGQSTAVLSKGLYDILSASIKASDAISVLKVSSKAAIGGLTSTAVAADAITTILNAYGLEASQAERVSDILFATVKSGKLTFEELGSTIGKVVSIAASAGLSLEQVAAAVATMTRNGIDADTAMTSLKGIITTFLSPTKESIDVAKKYGLELKASTLETLGLTGAMELLKNATEEDTAAIFSNVRALLGASATRKNITALMKDYELQLNSAGAAQEAFNKNANTLSIALAKNREEWAALKVTIGEGIAPALQTWLVGFSAFIKEWQIGFAAITHDAKVLAELNKAGLHPTQENFEFIDQMLKTDDVINKLDNSTKRIINTFTALDEARKKPFDIKAGVDIDKPAIISPEESDEAKKFAAEQAEAYRRLYDDLGVISQQSYEHRLKLIAMEGMEYKKFIDDKVLLMEWFNSRKLELDREQAIQGDNFQAGFTASLEKMQEDMASWGEIGAQSAQNMKSAFSEAIKSMVMQGATLKEAMHGFAMSMLSSFIDVIAQMIAMKTLAAAFGVSPVGIGAGGLPSAKGNIFRGGVKAYQKGGLITHPTVFPMANGGVGLAGEAGTEGIFPIARDAQGNLGVKNTGEESKQPIKIVNVVDPSQFEEFLNTGAGERAIINIMQRNREGANLFL